MIFSAWRFFFRSLFGYDYGKFRVQHGKHNIYVSSNIFPRSVWIRYDGQGRDGCGQRPSNWVSYEIIGKGINFQIDINTEECEIEWFATSCW